MAAGNEQLEAKLKGTFSSGQIQKVVVAYNDSLTYVFLLALVLSCLTCIGSLGVQWRNIKGIKR